MQSVRGICYYISEESNNFLTVCNTKRYIVVSVRIMAVLFHAQFKRHYTKPRFSKTIIPSFQLSPAPIVIKISPGFSSESTKEQASEGSA